MRNVNLFLPNPFLPARKVFLNLRFVDYVVEKTLSPQCCKEKRGVFFVDLGAPTFQSYLTSQKNIHRNKILVLVNYEKLRFNLLGVAIDPTCSNMGRLERTEPNLIRFKWEVT